VTAETATAGVLSTRALRGEAVTRVLEHASIAVLRGDAATTADIVVLVQPGEAEWERGRGSGRPLIAVVDHEPVGGELVELIEAGATGVLARACEPTELIDTLVRVGGGESGLTGRQARRLVEALHARSQREPAEPTSITPREREILTAIDAGLSVKETAQQLRISPRTVENTQRMLFRKLGVRSRSQAVARALKSGLLDTNPKRELS
jgi:DNA-binding CsgD family transcriptional regulator